MNINNIHILRCLVALLLCVIATSCEQDDLDTGKGQVLPLGKYPLQFTASVDGMVSRAAGKDQWKDDDSISVKIYPSDGIILPLTGKYYLNPDGSVKRSKDPVSWTYTDGIVKAWFPYLKEEEVKTAIIADQSEGFEDYDFLAAESEEKNYVETVDLTFKHQMAKVTCVLHPGDGITDNEWGTVEPHIAGFTKVSFSQVELKGSDNE